MKGPRPHCKVKHFTLQWSASCLAPTLVFLDRFDADRAQVVNGRNLGCLVAGEVQSIPWGEPRRPRVQGDPACARQRMQRQPRGHAVLPHTVPRALFQSQAPNARAQAVVRRNTHLCRVSNISKQDRCSLEGMLSTERPSICQPSLHAYQPVMRPFP